MRKNVLGLIVLLGLFFQAAGQIPAGYYDGMETLQGTALRTALHTKIKNHTSISYTSIWTHFQNTDKKANGKVWDMYSDIPDGTPPYEFTFVTDQCGNYGGEADCYNREHSWPQSWFNSSSPMVSDLFHIYATDGYVNGQRSNYAFGEVGTASWTSQNGSKKGNCMYPGYSGTVFEPIDEYKGDFARTFFYMATRYYTEDSGWLTTEATDGAELLPWTKNLLMEWHVKDPVSAKEIARNQAVYGIQNNRNPYIDHPEYAVLIFSDDYPDAALEYAPPVDTIYVGGTYQFGVSGSDAYSNFISFTASGVPAWITFTDHQDNTAGFTGQPAAADTGLFTFSLSYGNAYSLPQTAEFHIYVKSLVGVQEINILPSIRIYPNPANEQVYVSVGGELSASPVVISNLLGEQLKIASQGMITISELPAGLYLVRISGWQQAGIFIKQ